MFTIFYFYASYAFEHVHPLQSGYCVAKIAGNVAARFRGRALQDFSCDGCVIFSRLTRRGCVSFRLEALRRTVENESETRSHTDLRTFTDCDEYAAELDSFNATYSVRGVADKSTHTSRHLQTELTYTNGMGLLVKSTVDEAAPHMSILRRVGHGRRLRQIAGKTLRQIIEKVTG